MSKKDIQAIVSSLPNLSVDELRQVRAAIDFLLKGKEDTTQEQVSEDIELFYKVSSTVLEDAGIPCLAWYNFQQAKIHKDLAKGFAELEEYTNKHIGKLKRRDRQRLYRIYAEVLVDWMQRSPVPKRQGTFFKRLTMIPQLIAAAFPGYAQQGWLPLIVKMGTRDSGVK